MAEIDFVYDLTEEDLDEMANELFGEDYAEGQEWDPDNEDTEHEG